ARRLAAKERPPPRRRGGGPRRQPDPGLSPRHPAPPDPRRPRRLWRGLSARRPRRRDPAPRRPGPHPVLSQPTRRRGRPRLRLVCRRRHGHSVPRHLDPAHYGLSPTGRSEVCVSRQREGTMSWNVWMTKSAKVRLADHGSWGILYGFCGLMLLFLAAPVAIVLIVSFSDADFVYFPPPAYSVRWYAALVHLEGFVESFWLSLRLALLVTILAVALG